MESDVKKVIYAVADLLMDTFKMSKIFVPTLLKEIYGSVDAANRKLDDVTQKIQVVSEKTDKIYETISVPHALQTEHKKTETTPQNRASEYASVWDKNMFLNRYDKRIKNNVIEVKLSDVYLKEHLPHYVWMNNNKSDPEKDLNQLLYEYINNKSDKKMLLVLGQPGIGKSTLITWILANFKAQWDNIIVYKFAPDLEDIDWQQRNILINILDKLDLSYDKLNGKTLILDGFDEVYVGENRKKILDSLYWNLEKNQAIKGVSLIITCRENYIQHHERIRCKFITLQPWDASQIMSFREIYSKKTGTFISEDTIEIIIKNKKILGIPLILYMVFALNISIESEFSIIDVYEKIFALEGGIYDRCIENIWFEEPHRIEKIKKQIHQVSKEMAIWMFENDPEGASISKRDYEII